MKTIVKFPYWMLLLGLVFSLPVFGQNSSECKSILRDAYALMAQQFQPQPDQVLYLKTATRMKLRQGGATSEAVAETYSNDEQSYLLSSEMEVYEDQQVSVTVVPANKSIYIRVAKPAPLKENQLRQLTAQYDSLLLYTATCECEHRQGEYWISLRLNARGQQLFKADWVEIWLDADRRILRRSKVHYLSPYPAEEMEIVFLAIEQGYPTTLLQDRPLNRIFRSGNQLRDAYRGYEIYDLRHRNP